MKEEYSIVERTPATEEYGKLRIAAGWDEIDTQAAERGLNNSVCSVCAVHKGEVIGCGRLIGDGAMYFYLQDVIVLPKFQGKGIGRRIMEAIMDYIVVPEKGHKLLINKD